MMGRRLVYLVTTCRHATPPVRRLAKELAWSLGFAKKVNRGRMSLGELLATAKSMGASRLLIVGRGLHGNPGFLQIVSTQGDGYGELLMTIRLRGIVFGRLKRRPQPPESQLPVVSLNNAEEFAEDLAVSLATIYLGNYTADDVKKFVSYTRVIAVEGVGKRDFVAVIKFLEGGGELGPKLLVRNFTSKWLTH